MNTGNTDNSKRKNAGTILILFVLLVIVSSIYCASLIQTPSFSQSADGSSSSMASSQTFTINNQTTTYYLKPTQFEGDGFENGPPIMKTILPEGRASFQILRSINRTYEATVRYQINTRDGNNVGGLETTMYTNTQLGVPYFKNTIISGPFTTSVGTNGSALVLNVKAR
ncbi:hypothetical protein M3223_02565 [Paenibacillus pasadenensis]|uniref:hypothetical protein n=1 Tax=Paenibacillus pasadenensis TaxID=217090 RepID=UPI00204221E0|nr:hypothetical protein [Paenibacillus pasadenensis]MCM3746232.1 hypothetical protein [Paenibacillus pasadenensis]